MEQNRTAAHPAFSDKQAQSLVFIHAYAIAPGQPPAEADRRRHFRVAPPGLFGSSSIPEPQPVLKAARDHAVGAPA